VIVAVYAVLYARWEVGVNVATVPEYVTVPGTATPLGPVTLNVVVLIEADAIASLNVALSI
jgi:hypothetical protein